jgi:hypothetical protein
MGLEFRYPSGEQEPVRKSMEEDTAFGEGKTGT